MYYMLPCYDIQGGNMSYQRDSKIESEWEASKYGEHEYRELLRGISLFHVHCQTFMRRIIRYARSKNEGVRKLGCVGWYCEVCHTREINVGEYV